MPTYGRFFFFFILKRRQAFGKRGFTSLTEKVFSSTVRDHPYVARVLLLCL
jgi:hypothetical protein